MDNLGRFPAVFAVRDSIPSYRYTRGVTLLTLTRYLNRLQLLLKRFVGAGAYLPLPKPILPHRATVCLPLPALPPPPPCRPRNLPHAPL